MNTLLPIHYGGSSVPNLSGEWETFVTEGRRAVENLSQNQWTLGDLALRVVPVGKSGDKTGSVEELKKFSSEIGINFHTLKGFRLTANLWPPDKRNPLVSFSVHRLLRKEENHWMVNYLENKYGKVSYSRAENFLKTTRKRRKVPLISSPHILSVEPDDPIESESEPNNPETELQTESDLTFDLDYLVQRIQRRAPLDPQSADAGAVRNAARALLHCIQR